MGSRRTADDAFSHVFKNIFANARTNVSWSTAELLEQSQDLGLRISAKVSKENELLGWSGSRHFWPCVSHQVVYFVHRPLVPTTIIDVRPIPDIKMGQEGGCNSVSRGRRW